MQSRPPALVRTLAVILVALGAIGAAGCGTKKLNSDEAEKQIRAEVASQVGAEVKSVTCPDDVEAEKGGTFDCSATGGDGTKAAIKVTQSDDDGNVRFSAPLLHTGEAEQQLGQALTQQLETQVSVTCPDLVEAVAGKNITCKAKDEKGATRDVAVTIKDAQGNLTYKLSD